MGHTRAWRNFKRMQDGACTVASLIYAGAVVHGLRVLPGPLNLKLEVSLLFPSAFLLMALLTPLWAPPVRRQLMRYVWMSYGAGFGQTPASVISGLALLGFAAGFIYLQIEGVAHGGRYPSGVFSGYAAGIGVLFAQALLVRRLEREPDVQAVIEEN